MSALAPIEPLEPLEPLERDLWVASRTLVLTDLAFNVPRGAGNRARLFHWLVGATGRFGPHRVIRLGIRDRAAARRSIDRVLAWDFDRVIVSHGNVLPSGGRARLEQAFAFLPKLRDGEMT